jgi:hypothetical protein
MSTTYTAIATGNWSASTTWSSGSIPNPATLGSGDSVVIGNFTVTYDPNGGALSWVQGTLTMNGTTGGGLTANSVSLSGGSISIGTKSAIAWGAFNLTGGTIADTRSPWPGMGGFGTITTSGTWTWTGAGMAALALPSWVNNGGTGTLNANFLTGVSGPWTGLAITMNVEQITFTGNTTFNCNIGNGYTGWTFANPNIGITIPAGVTFTVGCIMLQTSAGGGNFLTNYGTFTPLAFQASTPNFKITNFGTLTLGAMNSSFTVNCPLDNYKALKLYTGGYPITTGANTKFRMMRREATFTDQNGYPIADCPSMSGFARYRMGA